MFKSESAGPQSPPPQGDKKKKESTLLVGKYELRKKIGQGTFSK